MVGRQWAYEEVMANLRRKQNTWVVGQGGIGKSTLLSQIAADLGPDKAYYIEAIVPAKSAMTGAYQIIGDFSDKVLKELKVSRWTLPQLTKALIKLLDGRDFVLILDGLDRITVASSEWLKMLAESDITLLGASRIVKEKKLRDRFFWTFETIQLMPMTDKEIKEVIRQQVLGFARREMDPGSESRPRIKFRDKTVRRYFVERAIKASKGIPFTAVELCKRAMGAREVTMTFVREHLWREHEASLKWIDATPILWVVICLIMAMRYIARGMHSTDAYVFFGALSMIMIVVRLFTMRGRRRTS